MIRGARARGVVLVLLLCGSLFGCAKPLQDERWLRVEAEGIELVTTLSEPEARAVVREVELLEALIGRLTGLPRPRAAVPTRIVVFARPTQLASIGMPQTTGLLSEGLRENVIVSHAPAARRAFVAERVVHQSIHASLRSRALRPQPSWYEEGLVALLSAARVRGDSIVIGDFPWSLKTNAKAPAWRSVDELIRIGPEDALDAEERRSFLAQSWALVRYLLLEHPGQPGASAALQRQLDLIDLGVSPSTAFESAFGVSVQRAERRIERALFDGRIEVAEIPLAELAAGASAPSVRPASPSEVAVALGVALRAASDPVGAEGWFRSAIAHDPDDARAHAGLGAALRDQQRWHDAVTELRAAVALAPTEPRMLLDLGLLYERQARAADDPARTKRLLEQAREQYALAEALDPDGAEVQARLGLSHLFPGEEASLALPYLNRAAAAIPGSPEILLGLAEAHLDLGEEAVARDFLKRARPTCGEQSAGATLEESIAEIRRRQADRARSAALSRARSIGGTK